MSYRIDPAPETLLQLEACLTQIIDHFEAGRWDDTKHCIFQLMTQYTNALRFTTEEYHAHQKCYPDSNRQFKECTAYDDILRSAPSDILIRLAQDLRK